MICYDFQLINAIMFVASLAITLVSVLNAKEQADRLKNSGFGTLASSAVSILITMIQKDNNVYLIAYTFAGCAIGALLGWIVIYRIVKKASNSKLTTIELIYTGLSGVKEEIKKRIEKKLSEF